MAGPPRAGRASQVYLKRSCQEDLGTVGHLMPWVFTATTTQTIMATPMRMPGSMPAWNMARVEHWLRKAHTTKLMEGGMMGPMPAEAAVTATEKFRS